MPRTNLSPDRFEAHHLWREAIALGQVLPVVPDKSVMYIGRLGMMSAPQNTTLLTAFLVRWTDRAGNYAEFNEGGVQVASDDSRLLYGDIKAAMGSVDELRAQRGILRDHAPWSSTSPGEQERLAHEFAGKAQSIQVGSDNDEHPTITAQYHDSPDQNTVSRLARINLQLARLAGDKDTSFYETIVTRAENWEARDHTPVELAWLLPKQSQAP